MDIELIEFLQIIKVPATVLHVVAVVVGMGSALVSDALFSFFGRDKKLNKTEIVTLEILARLVFYSLVAIILSGLVIFLTDIEKYTHSAKFLAKLSILGVLLVNGYFLNRYIWPYLLNKDFFTALKKQNIRRLAFAGGAISVVSWLAVCTLGVVDRLNFSYQTILSSYLLILFVAVVVSLWIERKEFN